MLCLIAKKADNGCCIKKYFILNIFQSNWFFFSKLSLQIIAVIKIKNICSTQSTDFDVFTLSLISY